jgi:protein phosphatase 2C family protein 2/3
MGASSSSIDLSAANGNVTLPVTAKRAHNDAQASLGLMWGVSDMQGWRETMEDAFVDMGSVSEKHDWAQTGLFGVFDGHGGAQVARFAAENLPRVLAKQHASKASAALHDSFLHMDKMLLDLGDKLEPADKWHPGHVGCPAVACLIRSDSIIVANAGDSRAVLSHNGKAVELSHDHKPDMKKEVARIRKAGGSVVNGRVEGKLAVSRAIGDLRFKNPSECAEKQMVSCVPDVKTFKRHPGDEFMVIACDGVWDVLSSQDVVNRVQEHLPALHRGGLHPSDVIGEIFEACLSPNLSETLGKGGDNMTMILIVFTKDFLPSPKPQQSLRSAFNCLICQKDSFNVTAPKLEDKPKPPKPSRPVLPALLGNTQKQPLKERDGKENGDAAPPIKQRL